MKSGLLLFLGLLALWADLLPASGQLRQVKTGKCPAPINAGAANCNNFCSTDADCPGSERCCSNGCGRECRLPTGVNPGYCPKIDPDIMTICIVECSNDRECGAVSKCCSLGCRVQCARAVPAKAGTCPKRRVLRTFAPCENKCRDDRDCPNRKKCCFTGCGLGCLAPVTGDICRLPPKTGPCEALIPRFFYNPASRTCESFIYGGCQGNGNNFRTLPECQRACRKREKPGFCRMFPPDTMGICALLCFSDADCPEAEKCCSVGCGWTCQTPTAGPTRERDWEEPRA
ncbi:WAP four-disulfide core domain protein 8-like isoform X2 [Gopherus evgoodei]|uniref:WAP four-disulfide core domain protein 8-like isoform X2 n=1 Tax=Gopherus evgoodei TaxID=1825980 RepID=UPI0011CEE550|nr:WAP four-disulfide core domain protein 8-like isoform X2 [Gopherus evgoodei]